MENKNWKRMRHSYRRYSGPGDMFTSIHMTDRVETGKANAFCRYVHPGMQAIVHPNGLAQVIGGSGSILHEFNAQGTNKFQRIRNAMRHLQTI